MNKPIRWQLLLVLSLFLFCLGFLPGQLLAGETECSAMKPGWVFCSGFEEGNKNIWDDFDGNPDSQNILVADGGPFGRTGNVVMRFIAPSGGGGGADLVKVLPSTYDKLYARWYIKWEAGYDFNANNHGGGLHAGSRDYLGRSNFRPTGSDWFSAWIEPDPRLHKLFSYTYYRGMYMDCTDPNGSCWGDHIPCMLDEGTNYCTKAQHRETVVPPTMQADRWYCVEMMVDGGAPSTTQAGATGVLDFWIDGVEIGPWNNMWFRTTSNLKIGILWLNLYFHDSNHSQSGVRYDDVVASTQRIGCQGVAPNPPTGLTVR